MPWRSRDRQHTVGTAYLAAAHVDGRGHHLFRSDGVHQQAHRHHVGDGVQ